MEVQLCDREFNYESNDRWHDFQFITVCEIRRKQIWLSLAADRYAVSDFPIRRIDAETFQKPYFEAPIRHIDQYAVSDFSIRRIGPRSRIFRPERVPYSKVSSIRRIDLPNTPYRPPEQPVYKEITPDDLGYAFNHQGRFQELKEAKEGPAKCSNP